MADHNDESSPLLDGVDFVGRLNDLGRRLDNLATAGRRAGLTEPDPGQTERWDDTQVWAHMAEFVGYWQGEAERVIALYDGDPVPFGRLKDDPDRIAGVEAARIEDLAALQGRVRDSIAELRRRLEAMTPAEWNAVGRHVRGFDLDVEGIINRFVLDHLEEHATSIEALAAERS